MTEHGSKSFSDKVADLCLQKYSKLPKQGKPQKGKEWTLMAGIVMATDNGIKFCYSETCPN